MEKYDFWNQLVERECAECQNKCSYMGRVYGKPGMMDVWKCSTHGKFYEVDAPLLDRGSLYTGMYNPWWPR